MSCSRINKYCIPFHWELLLKERICSHKDIFVTLRLTSEKQTKLKRSWPDCSKLTQGCKIPLARSHWRVNIGGGRVKLAMRSPDRASVFQSSEIVIFQSFGWKNGKKPT